MNTGYSIINLVLWHYTVVANSLERTVTATMTEAYMYHKHHNFGRFLLPKNEGGVWISEMQNPQYGQVE